MSGTLSLVRSAPTCKYTTRHFGLVCLSLCKNIDTKVLKATAASVVRYAVKLLHALLSLLEARADIQATRLFYL